MRVVVAMSGGVDSSVTACLLQRAGHEVIGLFMLPPADASITPPQQLGNAYAALTELNHYSRPDTVFTAHYDERNGFVKEKEAPFTRCYLLPGSASGAGPLVGAGVSPAPPEVGADAAGPAAICAATRAIG